MELDLANLSGAAGDAETAPNHQCMLYAGSPGRHLPGLATVTKQRLRAKWRCLYLNSPARVAEMRSCLSRAGVAVTQEVERGALILSSSQLHLQDGCFEVDRMLDMLADAVDQAVKDGYSGLWATGDMSWEFGSVKNFAKLLEYEYALERMFEQQPRFSGICQYHLDTLPTDVVQWGLCTHRSVYLNEAASQENPYYSPASLLTYRRPVAPHQHVEELCARPA
jgi:hypothetical protein